MQPTRYETKGSAPRFWVVATRGPILRVVFGSMKQPKKVSFSGGSTKKDTKFKTAELADAAAKKAAAEKVKAGYHKVRSFDEDLFWGGAAPKGSPLAPKREKVPRMEIRLSKSRDGRRLIDRLGGVPNAPAKKAPWPTDASGAPLELAFQIRGKAGGGEVDLGPVTLLQVFANLDSEDRYKDGHSRVLLHRKACRSVLEAPEGVVVHRPQAIRFRKGFDDPGLEEDEEAYDHAFCSKVRGIPVAANLTLPVLGSKRKPLDFLLQLNEIDEWFIWFVFVSSDYKEARLKLVRG